MTETVPNISVSQDAIARFCQRHHIKKLWLFGSVLRDDFSAESDVDVLVEFESGHVPGLAFFDMQRELGTLLGREVDLHTPAFLSRYFRAEVMSEAQLQYARCGAQGRALRAGTESRRSGYR